MDFDIRYRDYTFKHSISPKPDMSAERFKPHYHTTCEMLYFVRGNANYMLQHTLYNITPGALLIAKPGEYHNIVFRTDEPYERYVIRFDPQTLSPSMRKQLANAESVYQIEGTVMDTVFQRLDDHIAAVHKDMRFQVCLGSLHVLLAYLLSSRELIQKADYVNEDSRIIVEYIDAHLAEIRSADELAAALHMSKSTIYKNFSRQFDTPLMSYIRTQKCMAARELMDEGVTATEAAERLGFQHYSSFYRDYYQVFHESPSGGTRKKE